MFWELFQCWCDSGSVVVSQVIQQVNVSCCVSGVGRMFCMVNVVIVVSMLQFRVRVFRVWLCVWCSCVVFSNRVLVMKFSIQIIQVLVCSWLVGLCRLFIFSGSKFIVVKFRLVSSSIWLLIFGVQLVVVGRLWCRCLVIIVVSMLGSMKLSRLKVSVCGMFCVFSSVIGWWVCVQFFRLVLKLDIVRMNMVVVSSFN